MDTNRTRKLSHAPITASSVEFGDSCRLYGGRRTRTPSNHDYYLRDARTRDDHLRDASSVLRPCTKLDDNCHGPSRDAVLSGDTVHNDHGSPRLLSYA